MKRRTGILLATLVALTCTHAALAQSGGSDRSAFQFRMGWFFPSGDGEFWQVTQDSFTLSPSDFNGFVIGGSYMASLNNYLDLGFNMDLYERTVRSAARDFVDDSGFAILHDTTLGVLPLTADLRFFPTGRYAARGRKGQYLVRRPVPYLGVGGGAVIWSYEEVGDFVGFDGVDYFVYPDRLKDDGVEPEFHALGGIEIPVGPRWNVNFEGRYSWASTTPSGPFAYLQQGRLELGGWSMFVAGTCRF